MGDRPVDPRLRWLKIARPDQLHPPGRWRVWYVQGGRGGGKTRTGAQELADWILSDNDGEGEYGIVAPTYADAWTKCVEGESGLLRALGTSMAEVKDHRSATVKNAWRTYGQVVMHNGIVVYIDSAAEGGLRIQGRNLKGAWCDEIGLWLNWEVCWNESLKYAVRMGRSQIVATATPKASRPARKLIRSLIRNEDEHGGVIVTRLRTIDNRDNLSEEFLRAVVGAAQGTRLERQELEGELLDDVANALWTRDLLESIQIPALGAKDGPPVAWNLIIGVDPSDGNETSDEQAYTVIGEDARSDVQKAYVLESWGGQMAPAVFARKVVRRAHQLNAKVVVEKNHGGGWLKATFEQVVRDLMARGEITHRPRIVLIHASQAKRTRAEPISALYERGIIEHAGGPFVELEDQMATFTGAQGERSPDRLDSLVWAATPLLQKSWVTSTSVGGVRRWAAQKEVEEQGMGQEERLEARRQRRLAGVHGNGMTMEDQWDLDEFSPGNEDQDRPAGSSRGNIRAWH